MKILITGLFLLIFVNLSSAQVKFVERFEVESELYDPLFEMAATDDGLVSFRTTTQRGISFKRVFQYFTSDENLATESGLIEFPVKDGYDMLGFDTDSNGLYVLFTRGSGLTREKYILHIDLETKIGKEYNVDNVVDMELMEFLVEREMAIFMGTSDTRPVLQIYDLNTKSVHTVQGIYGNDTQILQIRKMPETRSLEVVLSRKGQYRDLEILINTYDLQGMLIQEVKVDRFAEQGQEIMNALLLSNGDYQQVMMGGFGLERRKSYQGMYIMEINEFGEYDFKLYTLEDFPNFFNYLNERQKERRDASVLKDLDKGKVPRLQSAYAIRDVREDRDHYYVYFDQFDEINSRGMNRRGAFSRGGIYRYDRWSRMGSNYGYGDPMLPGIGRFPMTGTYSYTPEYRYTSAHFIKVAKTGQVIWDNAVSYNDFTTTYPEAFGEIAIVGDELYHLFVEELKIKMSFFKNGEKIFENEEFELELTNEKERIRDTNAESLRLIHWYDRYFLLSGTQKVRYQDETGRAKVRDVYFLSKILVDGDLYEPKDLPD